MEDYLVEVLNGYVERGDDSPEDIAIRMELYGMEHLGGELTGVNYIPGKRFTLEYGRFNKISLPHNYNKKKMKKVLEVVLALEDLARTHGGKNKLSLGKNVSTNHHADGLKKLKKKVLG